MIPHIRMISMAAVLTISVRAAMGAEAAAGSPASQAASSQEVQLTPEGAFVWTEVDRISFDGSRTVALLMGSRFGPLGVAKDTNQVVRVNLARPAGDPQIRLVFLDEKQRRHPAESRGWASSRGISLATFESPKGCPGQSVRVILVEERSPATDSATLSRLSPLPPVLLGKPYLFALSDSRGRKIDSNSLAGRVVVLDLYTTWCTPHTGQLPRLKRLHEQYHDKGLEIVGIDMADPPEDVAEFTAKHSIPWPQVVLTEEQAQAVQAVTETSSLPRYLAVDRQGRLHNETTADELEHTVRQLLVAGSPAAATQPSE